MLSGSIYHVYNHANGRENLFVEGRNYIFFLKKLSEFISPVCSIYAYCLMPNHFHLVVGIKPEEDLKLVFGSQKEFVMKSQLDFEHKVSKSFSNLFSSYTQAFNKVYSRKGSLFIPSMKSQHIEDDSSFCKVIHYVHANPVHHGFVKSISDWKFSSFEALSGTGLTKLDRNYVLDIFGGIEAFRIYHEQPIDLKGEWFDE